MGAVRQVYARVPALIKAVPLVALLVFAAEMLQHIVEIRLGMYVRGQLGEKEQATRLIFGAVKVVAIFLALLFALRWWRFEGNTRRAARPTVALLKGLGIVILVQVGGELVVMALGAAMGQVLHPEGIGPRIALLAGPILVWILVATYLYPWYVGLLAEDSAMTLRRSIDGIRGRLWSSFGLFLAGFLPAMIVHYALGYAAVGRPEPLVWALMLVDSAVVALLALLIASAYYSLYERAVERTGRR